MRFATRVRGIGGLEAGAWHIHDTALERQARGEDVILLSLGDPDFPTPGPVTAAAKASLDQNRTHYAEVVGQRELRTAIAAHQQRLSGQEVDPDHVVVLAGAQCALFAACQCLLEPGDAILVPEPMYVSYPATVAAAGARLVRVPLSSDCGFHLDPSRVAAAIGPDVRAILLNSPHNPTGAVMSRAELDGVAEICRRHDLWLIADEVYATLVYEGEHISPVSLPGMAERTLTVSSLSKSHAMAGWRIGWLVGPPELARHVGHLALCMLYGSPAFIQDAAIVALNGDRLAEVQAMRERFRRRRDAVCRHLAAVPGLACTRPEGGLFVMLDIRRTGLRAANFSHQLLADEGVAVLAGDAFGGAAAGHVRLSLTVPDEQLAEACNRIARFACRLIRVARKARRASSRTDQSEPAPTSPAHAASVCALDGTSTGGVPDRAGTEVSANSIGRMRLAFTIEPAGEAHVGAMAAIYCEQIAEGLGTWEDPMPGSAEIGRRLAAVQSVGLPAYVGLDALGRVVGFTWVRPFRDRAAYRATVEDSIFVASRARRQGVGRGLLGAVIEASARLGYQQMMALVGDARNLPSIRLHESLGFIVVGYLRGAGSKPDGSVDVVLLQRDLREHRPAAGGGSPCSDRRTAYRASNPDTSMLG